MATADSPVRRALRRVDVKTIVFLVVVVTTGSLGSVCLRAGMEHDVIHASMHPVVLFHEFSGFVTSFYVWLGIILRIISGVAFMCLLSWADYSFVNPSASSAYIVTVFFGWLLLGEVVPVGRWIGTALITVGVLLIGMTPANTTRNRAEASPEGEAEEGTTGKDPSAEAIASD